MHIDCDRYQQESKSSSAFNQLGCARAAHKVVSRSSSMSDGTSEVSIAVEDNSIGARRACRVSVLHNVRRSRHFGDIPPV